MVVHVCNPIYTGSINRRIKVQVGLAINARPFSKLTEGKWTGGVAQVVEHLLSKLSRS
jgi:hypothetical protein